MRRTSTTSLLASLALLLAFTGTALGQTAPGAAAEPRSGPTAPSGPQAGPPAPAPTDLLSFGSQLTTALNLSESQKVRINALSLEFHEDHKDALARLEKLRLEAVGLMKGGKTLSREQAAALERKHGYPSRELLPAAEKLRQTILAELTPPQRKKIDDMRRRLAAPRT